MYKRIKLLFILLILLTLNSYAQKANFELMNLLSVDRTDELVVLKRAVLEQKLGKIPKGKFIIASIDNHVVDLQFDDLNSDGIWDEAVFLRDFYQKERKLLAVSIGNLPISQARTSAHVRQRRRVSEAGFGPQLLKDSVPAGQPNTDFAKVKLPPFLTEGPAWENDKVGFRIYMDVRNTKDIWGKTTRIMKMDTVGANPKEVYHNLADWGMDILAVGKSLGAGSLALVIKRPGKTDTLVRLGGKNMGKIVYERVSDGPFRAIFRMHYPEWDVLGNGKLTALTEQIAIWGGQYFYQSDISIKNPPVGALLVSGIVNLKSKSATITTDDGNIVTATYDVQSENKDKLGLAFMVKAQEVFGTDETSNTEGDVRNTYITKMRIPAAGRNTFRFYAAWEQTDPRFATADGFGKFLVTEGQKFDVPISIK